MSAMWVIYFAGVVGGIQVLAVLLVISLLIFAIFSVVAANETVGAVSRETLFGVLAPEKEAEKKEKIFKAKQQREIVFKFATRRLVPVSIILAFVAALTPSTQTIYMMAAAKVGQDIVTAPETKEISSKVLKIINDKLDEQLAPPKDKKP